jgi:ketosteroid isomerase-like protein
VQAKLPEQKLPEPKLPEPKLPEQKQPEQTKAVESGKSAQSKEPNTSMAGSGDERDAVEASVRKWAASWSAKQVDSYLASYASSFKPPKNEGREAWEQSRRQRINKPGGIKVDISDLQVQVKGLTARASFKQQYRATNLSQRTSKTLLMVRVDGRWLIEQELTDR